MFFFSVLMTGFVRSTSAFPIVRDNLCLVSNKRMIKVLDKEQCDLQIPVLVNKYLSHETAQATWTKCLILKQ